MDAAQGPGATAAVHHASPNAYLALYLFWHNDCHCGGRHSNKLHVRVAQLTARIAIMRGSLKHASPTLFRYMHSQELDIGMVTVNVDNGWQYTTNIGFDLNEDNTVRERLLFEF